IELLKRLALAGVARDLAHEHHHWRGILARDVDAVRGVGRARAAGDEADARPARHFAERLRHNRCPTLLAADGDGEIAVMESIAHRQIALARPAEHMPHAMDA